MCRSVLLCVFLTASLGMFTTDAHGQQTAAAFDVMTGIEGGGRGYADGVRRARTTLRAGADVWVDETPENRLGVAVLMELEPHASIGADLRYLRIVRALTLHAGALGIIAPDYMLGVTFGGAYGLSLDDTSSFFVGPSAKVFFFGGDLPDDQVVWQGMLELGVRIDL